MYKIISSPTIPLLERLMEEYEVSALGSLTISNGHYYQSFLGSPKVTEEPKAPVAVKEKPKPKAPAKVKAKPKTKAKPKK